MRDAYFSMFHPIKKILNASHLRVHNFFLVNACSCTFQILKGLMCKVTCDTKIFEKKQFSFFDETPFFESNLWETSKLLELLTADDDMSMATSVQLLTLVTQSMRYNWMKESHDVVIYKFMLIACSFASFDPYRDMG